MLNFNEIYKFYYEWWKNIDKTLFLLIIFLFGLGLFFSLVSSLSEAINEVDTKEKNNPKPNKKIINKNKVLSIFFHHS